MHDWMKKSWRRSKRGEYMQDRMKKCRKRRGSNEYMHDLHEEEQEKEKQA